MATIKKYTALKHLVDGTHNYVPGSPVTAGNMFDNADEYVARGDLAVEEVEVSEPEPVVADKPTPATVVAAKPKRKRAFVPTRFDFEEEDT